MTDATCHHLWFGMPAVLPGPGAPSGVPGWRKCRKCGVLEDLA